MTRRRKKPITVNFIEEPKPVNVSHTERIGTELSSEEFEALQIFKLQIPVVTNVGPNEALGLIYNEKRDIEFYVWAKDIKQYFKPGQYKRYALGYEKNGNVELFNLPEVEEQDW